MKILGTGLVCARGRGKDAVSSRDWKSPTFLEVSFQDAPFPAYVIDAATLKDPVLKGMRRADRFSKISTLAACDAVANSGVDIEGSDRVGIIFSTAFGPHNTTFKFQDDIIDYGDAGVSPTIFSNSVHNAAVSYISRLLKIKGPTWTVTGFDQPFEQAVALAEAWLAEGRCDKVLLGGGDECGTVMEYICSKKLPIASDGKITDKAFVPGEGAAFFMVEKGGFDLLGSADESWVPTFGNMLTGPALCCAAAMLENK
ncbi:MAG: beta-ketoacyl synthase chain length factor [Kiritimatiellaceae bacterium]|nr:beta-ketoacyl synthase chain length factor [Kiritimatiellaceae bacterium]